MECHTTTNCACIERIGGGVAESHVRLQCMILDRHATKYTQMWTEQGWMCKGVFIPLVLLR